MNNNVKLLSNDHYYVTFMSIYYIGTYVYIYNMYGIFYS